MRDSVTDGRLTEPQSSGHSARRIQKAPGRLTMVEVRSQTGGLAPENDMSGLPNRTICTQGSTRCKTSSPSSHRERIAKLE